MSGDDRASFLTIRFPMIVAVKLVFTVATLFYIAGYSMRIRNNALHQKLMGLGFACTLGIAVTLLVGVYGFDGTYSAAMWLEDMAGGAEGARAVLLTHRGVATLTLLVLIVQILAGLKRHPLHKRLFKVLIPLWIVTYVSGLVIFV